MKRLAYILLGAALCFACVPETIVHPSENDAPATASAYRPTVTVDQETNQVTFSLGEKAVIPVWVFQDSAGEWTDYKARDGYKKIFTIAGDYTVRMYVMNAAGTTPDYVEQTFHINNSIVNFDRYVRYIAGKESRVWRIDNEAQAHQACGESVANPTNWWAAQPDEKAGTGLYDNRLTFTSDGQYTFDPGDAGTVYVNKGVSVSPYGAYQADSDYTVPVQAETTPYEFSVEGNDLILKLKDGALFPYIPNDAYVTDSKFHVISLDNNAMELVWYTATGNGGGPIAWQFILTSKEGATVFNGFKYNADSNLWLPADAAHSYAYYYAPGWAQIADPVPEEGANGAYTLSLPEATSDQWQAQFFIIPDSPIALESSKNYDFSVVINTSKALPGLTLKLTDTTDDGNFLFTERISVPAGEDYVFYLTDLPGIDADAVKMVFDFGGNEADTEVTVSRIVLKDHAVDDGTVLPSDTPEGPDTPEEGAHYDITGSTNLWRTSTIEEMFYYYAPGWVQIADPVVTADNWRYSLSLPEATTDQWQAQVAFRTTMSSSADKKYDFCCTLLASEDLPGVTIKLVMTGDDGVFYCADRHKVAAGTPFVYRLPNVDGIDMEKISLFFDFGGNPAGTDVEIYDICFQEHQDPQGGGSDTVVSYDSDANLWKPADADGGLTLSYYYAPGWAQIADPELSKSGSKYTWTFPSATYERWQAQVFMVPVSPITLSAEKTYDFSCKMSVSEAMTAKLKVHRMDGDGNADDNTILLDEDVTFDADEERTITRTGLPGIDAENVRIVLDFGGCPDNTEAFISEIVLAEHTGAVEPEPEPEPTPSDPEDTIDETGTNLWPDANVSLVTWFSGADWSGGLEPQIMFPLDGNGIVIVVPEGTGGSEWMGQVKLISDIPASGPFNFAARIASTKDGVCTVKLTNDKDNAEYFYDNNVGLKAHKTVICQKLGVTSGAASDDTVMLIFDFGRMAAGSIITITDIGVRALETASYGENLWGTPTVDTWFSPGDWSGGLTADYTMTADGFKLTVPEGTGGSEWQGQFKMKVMTPVKAASQYDFSCKILADDSVTITVKLTDDGDSTGEFFYDNGVALTGSTPLSLVKSPVRTDADHDGYMLIFDFGRCPAGTEITVSDIVLREIL